MSLIDFGQYDRMNGLGGTNRLSDRSLNLSILKYMSESMCIQKKLTRTQLVEDIFRKLELNGSMKRKNCTKVDIPKDITPHDILHPEICVKVNLERLRDKKKLHRYHVAHEVRDILQESLIEKLNFSEFHNHGGDKGSSNNVRDNNHAKQGEVLDDSSISIDLNNIILSNKVCLEVRVVVVSEGNPLVARSIIGTLFKVGYVKIALNWCLYTYTGSILKFGRTTCSSNSPCSIPVYSTETFDNKKSLRQSKRKRRMNSLKALESCRSLQDYVVLFMKKHYLLQNFTQHLAGELAKEISRYAHSESDVFSSGQDTEIANSQRS